MATQDDRRAKDREFGPGLVLAESLTHLVGQPLVMGIDEARAGAKRGGFIEQRRIISQGAIGDGAAHDDGARDAGRVARIEKVSRAAEIDLSRESLASRRAEDKRQMHGLRDAVGPEDIAKGLANVALDELELRRSAHIRGRDDIHADNGLHLRPIGQQRDQSPPQKAR